MKNKRGIDRLRGKEESLLEDVYFGLYELERYANARDRYNKLVKYKDEFYESLYDEIRPAVTVFDEDLGRVYLSGQDTESMAIWIIGQKEWYETLIEREKERMELFDEAFSTLTEEEQQAFTNRYRDYSTEHFENAQQKLINYISSNRLKKLRERKEERKKNVMKQIEEWKRTAREGDAASKG